MARAFEVETIRLAMEVLTAASKRAQQGRADGVEVRLALRVLMPYTDRMRLEGFWSEVTVSSGKIWNHAGLVLQGIEGDLAAKGLWVDPFKVG